MSRRDDNPPAGEGWEPRVETCRVTLWRGYRTSAFYASASRDDDESGESVVEPSTSFRSRHAATPDADDVRSAHAELIARLKEDGWIQTGWGDEWYAAEFARSVLVPVAEPVVEPVEAPPPEPVQEPAPLPVRSAPPAPPEPRPEPEPVAPVAVLRAAPVARDAPSPRRIDGWRLAAAAGLGTAIALLGWVATHPSALPHAL